MIQMARDASKWLIFLASDQTNVIDFAEDPMRGEVWEKLLATYLLRYARLLQTMTRITAAMIVLIMGTPTSFGSPTILKWKKPTIRKIANRPIMIAPRIPAGARRPEISSPKKPTIAATITQTMSCVKVTVMPFLLKKKHA
jgi:hypothetical protein